MVTELFLQLLKYSGHHRRPINNHIMIAVISYDGNEQSFRTQDYYEHNHINTKLIKHV